MHLIFFLCTLFQGEKTTILFSKISKTKNHEAETLSSTNKEKKKVKAPQWCLDVLCEPIPSLLRQVNMVWTHAKMVHMSKYGVLCQKQWFLSFFEACPNIKQNDWHSHSPAVSCYGTILLCHQAVFFWHLSFPLHIYNMVDFFWNYRPEIAFFFVHSIFRTLLMLSTFFLAISIEHVSGMLHTNFELYWTFGCRDRLKLANHSDFDTKVWDLSRPALDEFLVLNAMTWPRY